jgi:hypothetical protein
LTIDRGVDAELCEIALQDLDVPPVHPAMQRAIPEMDELRLRRCDRQRTANSD